MDAERPLTSAISRLLEHYRQRLERLPFKRLEEVYRRELTAPIGETQFIDFASPPKRDELIRTLMALQECYLEGKTPMEIDDLLLDLE